MPVSGGLRREVGRRLVQACYLVLQAKPEGHLGALVHNLETGKLAVEG